MIKVSTNKPVDKIYLGTAGGAKLIDKIYLGTSTGAKLVYEKVTRPFTMKVNASDGSFTIPTTGTGYDYDVDWGDGNVVSNYTGNAQHTYSTSGEYIVKVYGSFPRIYFNNAGDKAKLLDIIAWGDIAWGSMGSALWGCSNLNISATDIPNLSSVTDMENMLRECCSLVELNAEGWDVSNVTTLRLFLSRCYALKSAYVSTWHTYSVTNMYGVFNDCGELIDLNISSWDVSKVTDFNGFLYRSFKINQLDLSSWGTGNVYRITNMLNGPAFPTIGVENWDVTGVTDANNFANSTTFPVQQYDDILCNWESQSLQSGVNISFGTSKYSPTGAACRTDIFNNKGWTITDSGPV